MSLLGLSVQFYADAKLISIVKNDNFFPVPRVDSAIIKISNISKKLDKVQNIDLFFQIAKAGFSQKRKKLRNSLAGGLRIQPTEAEKILNKAGINPNTRAETLSLEDWEKLYLVWEK